MDKQVEEVLLYLLSALQDSSGPDASSVPEKQTKKGIPVGISNRHVHLSRTDLDTLFGFDYHLTKLKDLSQPGQYACTEMVTIVGPRGSIDKVRILGPVRDVTQIEVLAGDTYRLGVSGELRMSGEVKDTPGIIIVGPRGCVQKQQGLIVAQRHIHMTPEDAEYYEVKNGDIVDIKIEGPRGGILSNVAIRATNTSALECHIDTEEANGLGLTNKSTISIFKH